jgi:predicted  nucleic acid-binding Zn-ribbon protein
MTPIELLRDLQRTLDLLQTIDRDLQAYPPDLAELAQKVKALEKAAAEDAKALADGRAKAAALAKELAGSKKALERTQEELRHVNQKVQYAALIREKEEREKAVSSQAKPLKELEAKLQEIEARLSPREAELATVKAQFDELRAVFLAEHGNQVAGQEELEAKRTKLEAELAPADLARFRKVAQARGGKAVVPVENGHCLGCRTRLRPSVMADLRAGKGLIACEACQRYLYLEA